MTTSIGLSAEEITNLYLWGSVTRPNDLLSSSVIRSTSAQHTPTSVNVNEYMTDGPGRYATAHDFSIVNSFFGSDPAALRAHKNAPPSEDAIFSEEEFRNYLGGANAIISQSQSFLHSGSNDFAERVYVWETVGFEIDDRAQFVVTPAGELEIRQFAIIPFTSTGHEDFDFKGGWTANLGAYFLEDWVDPSRIGRTVDIFFSDTRATTTFTQTDYNAGDQSLDEDVTNFPAALPAIIGLTNDLFDNGIIKFEYEGKALVYGTYGGGVVNIDDKINDDHEDLASHGIVFVGSAQDDIVHATNVDSMLLGNEGADQINSGDGNDDIYGGTKSSNDDGAADTLTGGSGNDTYYVGLGDVVVEVTEEGTDLVQSSVTYTLGDNVEHLLLTGSDVINGTGNNQGNAIIGNSAANEIIGGDGEDVLIGGAGDDKLYGDGDSDTVDYLDGGAGADEFYVGEGDIVLNFNAGDKIYLNGVLLTGGENFRQWAYDDALDAQKVVLPFVDENGVAYTFVDTGFGEGGAMAVMTASMTAPVLIFGVELADDTEADVRTVSGEEEGSWQSAGLVAEGGFMRFTRWDGIDHHIPELDPIPEIPEYAMDLYDWQVAGGVPGEFSEEEATWSIVDAAPERVILSGYDGFAQTWDQQLLLSTWGSGGTE